MEKRILNICCCTDCLFLEMQRLCRDTAGAERESGLSFTVKSPGAMTQFILPGRINRTVCYDRFDAIQICGHVVLSPRQVDMLRARLTNPDAWPGYFPKIP